jgi:glycerol-3-phosphate dehydrogenase
MPNAPQPLLREDLLARLRETQDWDVVIVGGGATGLGAALDAAARGYRTLLLEQQDFAQGTSSRSTKLIHGGVRYLAQLNFSLVREALHERKIMLENAPAGTAGPMGFIIPAYSWIDLPFYGAGLKLYDLLAGASGLPRSRLLSASEVFSLAPGIAKADDRGRTLKGGIQYYDGQFDDAKFAIGLMRSAFEHGALALNYMPVTALIKHDGKVSGVMCNDAETGEKFEVRAKVVINATGVYVDHLRLLDNPATPRMVSPSQGAHIVVDRKFLPGDRAVLVPKTSDGRVLFCIPWMGKVLIGTTDVATEDAAIDPLPTDAEIDYLLQTAARVLAIQPKRSDILAQFAGLRPLVRADGPKTTSGLSREHAIDAAQSGLVSITGGKWTTYRKMAEDVVDVAANIAGLPKSACTTKQIRLPSFDYGATSGTRLHPDFNYDADVVLNAFRYELARQPDDILSRRTRVAFVDSAAADALRPEVASMLNSLR